MDTNSQRLVGAVLSEALNGGPLVTAVQDQFDREQRKLAELPCSAEKLKEEPKPPAAPSPSRPPQPEPTQLSKEPERDYEEYIDDPRRFRA